MATSVPVNLRNLGVGNTLVLLNGRRVVAHPTSRADENLVPVLTYNTNAIPVSGIKRLEVLRDGAAALYGSTPWPAWSTPCCATTTTV